MIRSLTADAGLEILETQSIEARHLRLGRKMASV